MAQIFSDSNTYFGRNPLNRWFHWLEKLLTMTGLGSFYASTACHLALVQWATGPVQGKLRADVWQRLVDRSPRGRHPDRLVRTEIGQSRPGV